MASAVPSDKVGGVLWSSASPGWPKAGYELTVTVCCPLVSKSQDNRPVFNVCLRTS